MSEQQSNNNVPSHKSSFMDKIKETFTGHHHQDHKASADSSTHHQYGGAENQHDCAYASEAGIVGAHAIPPMTFHADPNHHHGDRNTASQGPVANGPAAGAQAQAQSHAQTTQNRSEATPFEEFGDRYSGHDLHSAGAEPNLPTK